MNTDGHEFFIVLAVVLVLVLDYSDSDYEDEED
jgi:hypothetical protein